MKIKKLKEVLKIISGKIGSIDWAVMGSSNMALHGMDVTPNDLDIVVRFKDLEKIRNIFEGASEIKELKTSTRSKVWEVNVVIDSIDVQFLGEKKGVYTNRLKSGRTERVEGFLCLTLEAEAECYAETFREEKAEKTKRFLEGFK